MAKKRIVSLLLGAVLAFGLFVPALASGTASINLEYHYLGESGETQVDVTTDIDMPLSAFVETNYNGAEYTLTELLVHDPDPAKPDPISFTGQQVASGATYFFPDLFASDFRIETHYTSYVPPQPPAPSGSSSGGGGSDNLGFIIVIGVPDGPVETGHTFRLSTIPSDTTAKFDEAFLSMERNANGSYDFTGLKTGRTGITFSRAGYYDRYIWITLKSSAAAVDNAPENTNDNPGTGASAYSEVYFLIGLGFLTAGLAAGKIKVSQRRV